MDGRHPDPAAQAGQMKNELEAVLRPLDFQPWRCPAMSTSPAPCHDRRSRVDPRRLAILISLLTSTTLLGCSLSLDVQIDGGGRTLNVYADRGWQDTGVSLAEGEEVVVTAISGQWFEDPPGVWHDASGGPDPWICGESECHEPLPDVPKYALLARIGDDGRPFLVGEFSRFFAEEAGRLFLRANYGDRDIPIHRPQGTVKVRIDYDR